MNGVLPAHIHSVEKNRPNDSAPSKARVSKKAKEKNKPSPSLLERMKDTENDFIDFWDSLPEYDPNKSDSKTTQPNSITDSPIIRETETISPQTKPIIWGRPPVYPTTILTKTYELDYENNFNYLNIIPGIMKYYGNQNKKLGFLNTWKFESKMPEFRKIVSKLISDAGLGNPMLPSSYLRFALKDPPSMDESVKNEYGESFLEKANNLISDSARQLVYLSNGNYEQFAKMMKDNVAMVLGDNLADKFSNLVGNLGGKKVVGVLRNLAKSESPLAGLAQGYRLDAPKIWHNSTTDNSKNINIKLFSPIDNDEVIIQHIIVPLTALMVMAYPISDRAFLYRWPFVVKYWIKGLIKISMGYISSLSLKFLESSSIKTSKGRFLSVDVTLELSSLYSVRMTVSDGPVSDDMLTTNRFIENIVEGMNLK